MKSSIATLLLVTNASAKNAVDVQKMVDITEGVLMGALQAEGFTDIEHCIQDVETFVSDAEIAITDFEKKSASGVIDGLKEVAAMYKVIQAGMKDCTSAKADWAKLEEMISIFNSPTSFAYHVGKDLIVNGAEIYGEVNSAVNDYKVGSWYDFGIDIGEASAHTFLGDSKFKMAQIAGGMMEPFGLVKFDPLALLVCIGDEDEALLALDEAVQEFEIAYKEKSIGDLIGGAILTFAAYQQAMQGLPACEAIPNSFQKTQFETSMHMIENPKKYINIIAEDTLENGFAVFDLAEEAVLAYKAGNMETFGVKVGTILETVTTPEAQNKLQVKTDATNKKMVTEVLQGFLAATKVGTFNFTNLLICIYEADQSAEIGYEAVEIFEEAWADKDIMEAVGGVIATVAFVQGVEQTIPICKTVDQTSMDWTHFNKIVSTLWNKDTRMEAVEDDIFYNGQSMTSDLRAALESLKEHEYRQFGYKLGSTLEAATNVDQTLFLY